MYDHLLSKTRSNLFISNKKSGNQTKGGLRGYALFCRGIEARIAPGSQYYRGRGNARFRDHFYRFNRGGNRPLGFATLHTPDAPQTIERIIDVFPPHQQQQVKLQFSDCLQGVISQLLLPSATGKGRVLATEIMVALRYTQPYPRAGD